MRRRWRGALVGFGEVARLGHLPGWLASEQTALVAVVDPAPERLAWARRLLPEVRTFSSTNELWEEVPLDFVDIATPPVFHAEIALAALMRGVAVLCEKPLVTHPADYLRLARASRDRNLPVHTVHNWRYSAAYKVVSDLLRSGAIGAVRHVTICVQRNGCAGWNTGSWRLRDGWAGGGILVDHGWHAFYLVCDWMNQPPRAVRAVAARCRYLHAEVEDTVTCWVDFPQGRAEIELTWAATRRYTAWRIEGEAGTIRVEDGTLYVDDGQACQQRAIRSLSEGSYHPDWFAGVAREFFGTLADPRRANLVDAGWCVALLSQAYRSIRQGSVSVPVSLPDFVDSR